MAVAIDSANKYRQRIGVLLGAYEDLIAINEEYIALDIGNKVSDSDFPDITQAEFVAGVAAAQTIVATIASNDTNLNQRVGKGARRVKSKIRIPRKA
jgi:hypothetical protein